MANLEFDKEITALLVIDPYEVVETLSFHLQLTQTNSNA